jgi:hypothetical protein
VDAVRAAATRNGGPATDGAPVADGVFDVADDGGFEQAAEGGAFFDGADGAFAATDADAETCDATDEVLDAAVVVGPGGGVINRAPDGPNADVVARTKDAGALDRTTARRARKMCCVWTEICCTLTATPIRTPLISVDRPHEGGGFCLGDT